MILMKVWNSAWELIHWNKLWVSELKVNEDTLKGLLVIKVDGTEQKCSQKSIWSYYFSITHPSWLNLSYISFTDSSSVSHQLSNKSGAIMKNNSLLQKQCPVLWFQRLKNVSIFWFLYSSLTVDWMSLGCGQNETFEDVILGFGKHSSYKTHHTFDA